MFVLEKGSTETTIILFMFDCVEFEKAQRTMAIWKILAPDCDCQSDG